MKEIIIKGIVREECGWYLETEKEPYTADLLAGIDEVLQEHKEDVLHYGDEIELIIRVKRN